MVCYNFSMPFNINLNTFSILKVDESKELYTFEQYEDVNIMPCVRRHINFNPNASNHVGMKQKL